MEQRGPFRFLPKEEFEKLSQVEKIVYLDGATAELKRRGEELRDFTTESQDTRFANQRNQ